MSCDCCGADQVETNTREGEERSGGGAVAKAAEELEEDVVGSRVSDVLVFPSSARSDDVGETKCCLFCMATLRFTNKNQKKRSCRSSYFEVRINFSVLVRSSFNFFGG
jgi:hypothetical protein